MLCRIGGRWSLMLSLWGVLAVMVVGCGSGQPERAVVKGKVTVDNTPLTIGTVTFWGAKDSQATAAIDKNGQYVMNDAPVGDVKITVTVPNFDPRMLAKMRAMRSGQKDVKSVDPTGTGMAIPIMGEMPDKIVPIPDKYADVSTSDLTYTVVSGEQTKDIPLKR